MKKYILCFFSSLLLNYSFATEKEIIKASISDVVVYTQGAQINMKSSYNVKPGITELIIEGVSPYIDANSLQVKAFGNVILMDSKYQLYYPKPENTDINGIPLKIKRELELLQDSVDYIAFDIKDLQDEIDVLNATKSILNNNGAVRGQGKVNDSINLLKQTVEFYQIKMNEINKKMQLLLKKRKAKDEYLAKLNEKLQNLRNFHNNDGDLEKKNGPIHRIVVTVQSKEIIAGKLNVSYLVANAGWVPQYDLRSDGMDGKINLTYKAKVYQNTGLDWENIKLSISTNNPYQNKTKPELHPWYIDYYTYKNYNSYGGAAPTTAPTERKKESLQDNISYSNTNQDEINAITSADFVETVRQLSSIEFKIDLPYSIKSNNEQHMVLIKNVDLDAKYKYYAVPKMDQSVYLMAQITKLDELGLVPASANIFFDGSYIGETYIDPTVMDDTLNLSMGKDPNIQIKRTLLKKQLKEKIINDKIERTFAYSIEVKNSKATSIDIVVQDQIPVTTNADITIEAFDLGKCKYDATTGFIDWEFNLKPKESKTINFSFKVKHNKDKNVIVQ